MFENFVGQRKIVKELSAILFGLQKNPKESVNIILRGPAGCGKTMLADEFCKRVSGNYGYQVPDKEFMMTGIDKYRCQIVDEVHIIKRPEVLYPWLDKGEYVFIFCTTDFGDLPDALTSRCIQLTFEEYTDEEIGLIVLNYGKEISMLMAPDTAILIAKQARGKPRIAKKFVKRMKFIIDRGYHPLTIRGVKSAFNDIGVFAGGYTDLDIRYLKFLSNVGRASMSVISRSIGVDENTLKNDVEPFLIDKGHIEISSRGRKFINWEGTELW